MEILNENLKTLNDLIDFAANKYADKAFLRTLDNECLVSHSYKTLLEDILKFINKYLINIENKHIALFGSRNYEFIVAMLAIIYSGNILVLINPNFPLEQINKLLLKSDTNLIFIDDLYNKKFDFLININLIVYNYRDFQKSNANIIKYNNENKDAIFLFTSGTTGENKIVVISHKNIVSTSKNIPFGFHGIVAYHILPISHSFGLSMFFINLLYGETIDLGTNIINMPNEIMIYKSNITMLPPLVLKSLYRQILLLKSKGINFPIKSIVCGGAPLDKETILKYYKLGIVVCFGYGLTETFGFVSCNDSATNHIGSVGIANKFSDCRIVDNEIWLKTDTISSGYYKDFKNNNNSFENGWLKTGDLGYIEDGYLYVTGRKKNILVLPNGENVSPEEIENLVYELDYIEDAFLYIKKIGDNEILSLMLFTKFDNYDKILFDIKNINSKLIDYKNINLIEISATPLDKNANGKIIREKNYEIKKTIRV